MRNKLEATGLAVLIGLMAAAAPAAGHTVTDDKAYTSHCDAFVVRCIATQGDPTGGALCSGGTCRFGGAIWQVSEITALHSYESGGLDVKATVVDDVGQGDWAVLCVGQDNSSSDPQGNVCNDPRSEPDATFCGTSPWLTDAVKKPFTGADWVGVFLGGPVTQAWSNRPDAPDPLWDAGPGCNPLAAGATTGTITLFVR